jgi:hypothetical protein
MTMDLAASLDVWDIQERGMAQGLKSRDLDWCKEHLLKLKEQAKAPPKAAAAAAPPPPAPAAAAAPPPAPEPVSAPAAAPPPKKLTWKEQQALKKANEPPKPAAAPAPAPGRSFGGFQSKAPAKKSAAPAGAAKAAAPSGGWPAKMPAFEIDQKGYQRFAKTFGEMTARDIIDLTDQDVPKELMVQEKIWLKKYIANCKKAAQAAIDAKLAKGPPPPGHERFCDLYGVDLDPDDVLTLTVADVEAIKGLQMKDKIFMKKHLRDRQGVVNPNLAAAQEEAAGKGKPAWQKR